jgi:hypothetical protein
MTLRDLLSVFALSDGYVLGLDLDYPSKSISIRFKGRRMMKQNKFDWVTGTLQFSGVTALDVYEDFPTDGGCTDVTLTRTDDNDFYLSLDPYGNSGLPHEQDNWIVKAAALTFIDADNMQHTIG